MGYQSKTYSLSDEVVEAIEEAKAGGVSPNQFLRQLMGFDGAKEPRKSITKTVDRVPGVSQGMPPKVGGFLCRCIHSGCYGAKFSGPYKGANLCDGCLESGHRGEPKNCPECTAGVAA